MSRLSNSKQIIFKNTNTTEIYDMDSICVLLEIVRSAF